MTFGSGARLLVQPLLLVQSRNGAYMPLAPDEVNKRYKYSDHRGLYREGPLTSKGLTGGGYDYEFRGHYGPWEIPRTSDARA